MLLSLILYGSRARGDHRLRSDVDLLGVVEGRSIEREISARGASFYHYPSSTLLNKAKRGDLFVLHLIEEGVVLHDTVDFFDSVREKFRYKRTYFREVQQGQAIIRFFANRLSVLNSRAARKRLVWAIRTILIARSAEKKSPVFSSRHLELFSGHEGLKDIIDSRTTIEGGALIEAALAIETRFGVSAFDELWPNDLNKQERLLRKMGGIVEDTLRFCSPGESEAPDESDDDEMEYVRLLEA